ncbi:MAG: helix-turn-helix domain-containing protein [Acidimicrobiia bacterium]|nr:helix-turn-helix domain-containing protein [Acidimicrobiia bacterium]
MISSELRASRRLMGLTLAQLSDLTGIAQPNLSRLELGKVDARLSTIEVVAGALGLELSLSLRTNSSLDAVQARMQQGSERLGARGITNREAAKRLEWKRRRGIDTSTEENLLT